MVDRVKEKEQQAMEVERQQIVIDELKAAVFEWNLEDESFYCSPSFKDYALARKAPRPFETIVRAWTLSTRMIYRSSFAFLEK